LRGTRARRTHIETAAGQWLEERPAVSGGGLFFGDGVWRRGFEWFWNQAEILVGTHFEMLEGIVSWGLLKKA
jgi:hypothetical protein